MHAIRTLVALLVPPRCAVCGAACAGHELTCAGCELSLKSAPPALARLDASGTVWSSAPYEGAARGLVAALKFAGRLPLAARAAECVAGGAPPGLIAGTVVPVPASPSRRRQRGFDAADAIAAALARRTGLPIVRCLRRDNGPRQVGRSRLERLSDPPRIRLAAAAPLRALLVDDVLTTGATLGACAAALRAGGTTTVHAVTFAFSK